MDVINWIVVLLLSYLVGSFPTGYLAVRIANGKDVRTIASGRTGGTNTMRAAGVVAGLITGAIDVLKAYSTYWIVTWFAPGQVWLRVFAAFIAVIGHNYSIFLIEKSEKGKMKLRGGAGGAPALGGSIALWLPSVFFILPFAVLLFIFVGYASVVTISIAFSATILFAVLGWMHITPVPYVVYGILTLVTVLIALQPNIKALCMGKERLHGLRAYIKKHQQKKDKPPLGNTT